MKVRRQYGAGKRMSRGAHLRIQLRSPLLFLQRSPTKIVDLKRTDCDLAQRRLRRAGVVNLLSLQGGKNHQQYDGSGQQPENYGQFAAGQS